MILGYSELARHVFGVTPDLLRRDLQQLLATRVDEDRILLVRTLATRERATVSELLRSAKRNNTGGSYLAARAFLDRLVELKLIERSTEGRRTYYIFPKGSSLAAWLRAGE